MKTKITIACGGTGGHIHPALAVADQLREEGHTLSLIVSGMRSAEASTIASWQGPLLKSGARKITDLRNIFAILRCIRFLRKERPDVLFATGGYTSFAPVIAARFLRIPVVLHEANSLIGKAVRFLAKYCKIETVALSFEASKTQLPAKVKTQYTGLPLRRSVLERLERAKAIKRDDDSFNIFVTGGSQGAHGMNVLVAPVLASLAASDKKVHILHQCGPHDLVLMEDTYKAVATQVRVQPYVQDMGTAYGEADVVIARAGASTCFEIAACAKPTLFVPLPTAMDDHQRKNAEALVVCGGAICVNQLTTTPEEFANILRPIYQEREILTAMHEALKRIPQMDATTIVARLLLSIAQKKS